MRTNNREILIYYNPESDSDRKMVAHAQGMSPHIRTFDEKDWLTVIANNPDLIKAPIAVRGRRAILCSSPTDIYKLTAPSAPRV
jgi:arsenate reductase-like glutaredoxin family protein